MMNRQPPRRVGILSHDWSQPPFAEFDNNTGRWRIWISYNPDVTAGTYLDLYHRSPVDPRFNGMVDRVTIGPNGEVSTITTIAQPLQVL